MNRYDEQLERLFKAARLASRPLNSFHRFHLSIDPSHPERLAWQKLFQTALVSAFVVMLLSAWIGYHAVRSVGSEYDAAISLYGGDLLP